MPCGTSQPNGKCLPYPSHVIGLGIWFRYIYYTVNSIDTIHPCSWHACGVTLCGLKRTVDSTVWSDPSSIPHQSSLRSTPHLLPFRTTTASPLWTATSHPMTLQRRHLPACPHGWSGGKGRRDSPTMAPPGMGTHTSGTVTERLHYVFVLREVHASQPSSVGGVAGRIV